jgi:RNA polymerase sigma-70 factor (ECF subfamily)
MAPNAHAVLELRDLRAAIEKLPPEQRQTILLVGLEGMRYDEVAIILGVPVGTIRSRLSRGRDQLRKLMGIEDEARLPAAIEPPTAHQLAA